MMKNIFLNIRQKLYRPTVDILNEALKLRADLSETESDLITYMAGFTHYEFAKNLFNDFGLMLICNDSILFDRYNNRFHVKALINDHMDLPCFNMNFDMEVNASEDEVPDDGFFHNIICWRNIDGGYIDSLYEDTKKFNLSQYHEYCNNHIIGVNENIFPYVLHNQNHSVVIHIAIIPTNSETNVLSVLNRVSNGLFFCHNNDRSHLSTHKIIKQKDLYGQLSSIEWTIVFVDDQPLLVQLFDSIQANYNVVEYRGEEYNYFHDFVSAILASTLEKINLYFGE